MIKKIFLLIFILVVPSVCHAAVKGPYNSIEDINTAIGNSVAGDTIIVSDGIYTDPSVISFSAQGTSEQPIILRAQTPGGVVFTGDPANYFITMTGKYLILADFRFQNLSGAETTINLVDADYCRITNCSFENCDQYGGVIEIKGIANNYGSFVGSSTNNRIDHCIFDGCDNVNIENFIVDIERYGCADLGNIHNTFDHLVFRNLNHSAIQIGRGSSLWAGGTRGYVSENATDAYCTVENCYFSACTAQKTIENKSSNNTYRYNIFQNGASGQLALRGGDDCIVDGNFFFENGETSTSDYRGIKVCGSGHVICNNYLQGPDSPMYPTNLSIVLLWGKDDGFYSPVSNVLIANNTIRNSNRGFAFNKGSSTIPPVNCTFINNLAENHSYINPLFGYGYAGTGHIWTANRGHVEKGYLRHSSIPEAGVTDSGAFELTNTETSSWGDWYYTSSYASGTYNANVTDDIEGRTRSNPPKIGCRENNDAAIRPMIKENEVGIQWPNSTLAPYVPSSPSAPSNLQAQ